MGRPKENFPIASPLSRENSVKYNYENYIYKTDKRNNVLKLRCKYRI